MSNVSLSARLQGDWTVAGVMKQIDPLTELSELLDPSTPRINVDCSAIEMIDVCGFQLLYTWLHCLQVRGFEPTLVKIPDEVEKAQHLLGSFEVFHGDTISS